MFLIADDNILWIMKVPLTTLTTLRLCPGNAREGLQHMQYLAMNIVFPHFSSLFDIFINFHGYANEIFFI